MPRRSIILQQLEQNEKKLNSYNEAVGGFNAEVERRNANYNTAVGNYNDFLARVQSGQAQGLVEFKPGQWAQSSGGKLLYVDKRGNPAGDAPLVNNVNELMQSGAGAAWVRYGDEGKATYLKRDQAAAFDPAKAIALDKKWAEIQANPAAYQVPMENGGMRYNDEALATMMQANSSLGVMRFDTPAPTPPPTPVEPDFYTMSRREEAELANPTATTAEATLAANKGLPVKTELVNQQSAGNSVFAERDQEQAIKQSGILARVLSGQIA